MVKKCKSRKSENNSRQMRRNAPTACNSFLTLKQELKYVIRGNLIQHLPCLADKTKLAIDPLTTIDYQPKSYKTDSIINF